MVDTSKLADVSLGIKVHRPINGLEKQTAIRLGIIKGTVYPYVFLGLREPFSWLCLHNDPIPARDILFVGMQFADLCLVSTGKVSVRTLGRRADAYLLQSVNLTSETLTEGSSGLESLADRSGVLPRPPGREPVHTRVSTALNAYELYKLILNSFIR